LGSSIVSFFMEQFVKVIRQAKVIKIWYFMFFISFLYTL
jgi:hypothetical protein